MIKTKVAIDVESLSNFQIGGKRQSLSDMLDFFNEHNILLYSSKYGDKPLLFDEDCDIELIDTAKMSQYDIDKFWKKHG